MNADTVLRAAVDVALARREHFDALDAAAGDGDFGTTLARGAAALTADPPADLRAAARTLVAAMGGSSGPLLGAAALRASDAVGAVAGSEELATTGRRNPISEAIEGIQGYGEAERGDKTLLDALFPVAEAVAAGGDAAAVASAAREGAAATESMAARRGRAAYGGDRSKGAPDPGAVAVAEVCERLAAGGPPSWDELAGRVPDEDLSERGDPLVDQALDGLVLAQPALARLDGQRVIVRRDRDTASGRVTLVSGGGAGHEPMHAGFVGEGMLDGACPGSVFTSPAPDQMVAAAEAVHAGGGVLFVVKNYTGDVLNFRLAAELLDDAIETATVLIADDVATDADAAPGRRGTGATIVVEKLAGARAAAGGTLAEVTALAEGVAASARSFGVAFHGDEMEPGVGIHGEPGRDKAPLARGRDLAEVLLDPVLAEVDTDGPVLVLLSGLGGSAPLAIHALFADVAAALEDRGVRIARTLVGDLITSMDQPGAVLTLVPLDEERTALWDAHVWTPALRW